MTENPAAVKDRFLPPERVPLHSSWIGGGTEKAVRPAFYRGDAAERPLGSHRDVVATLAQLRDRRLVEACLDRKRGGVCVPREERARKVIRVVLGCLDRRLQVHRAHDVVEEGVQGPLILLVAAGRAERDLRLAVTEDERRRERRPRTRAGAQRRRQPLLEPEHLRPRPE